VNDALKKVSSIGLPTLSSSMGGIAAPAIANGNMALSGGGGGVVPIQFVYQPFIGMNDEYEAEKKLTDIINRVNRKSVNR